MRGEINERNAKDSNEVIGIDSRCMVMATMQSVKTISELGREGLLPPAQYSRLPAVTGASKCSIYRATFSNWS
jgi:hypothetical protein